MKKITIVGGGLAGCFTALEYGFNLRHQDIEVELLHDPTKKAEKVGAGSLMYLPQLLFSSTGFNWCANNLHATLKTGLTFEGWGKVNDKFVHPFPSNRVGMHFSPVEMQNYILNSNWFKVTETKVTDINNIDSDFIVDCRGKPKDMSEYQELKNPLNACLLGKPKFNTFTPYTRNITTPDGYTFIIPTASNSPSYEAAVGYLYNNEITSRKDAESNFLELFDVEITGQKSFKSYVAKNPIENDRVFKNGNRLFFLEPLEATSTETYLHAADIYAGVMYGQNSVKDANNLSLIHISEPTRPY